MTGPEPARRRWKRLMLPSHHIRILVTGAGVAPADVGLMRPPSHSCSIPTCYQMPLTGLEPVSSVF